jgi:hypothetical protein
MSQGRTATNYETKEFFRKEFIKNLIQISGCDFNITA